MTERRFRCSGVRLTASMLGIALLIFLAPGCRKKTPDTPVAGSGSAKTPVAGSGSAKTPEAGSGSAKTPVAGSGDTKTPVAGSGSTGNDPAAIGVGGNGGAAIADATTQSENPEARKGPFPDSWFFDRANRSQAAKGLEERDAPLLYVTDWIGEPQYVENLEGKVVVVWFWGANRRATIRGIPRLKKLADDYRDQDVVIIGVHESGPTASTMPAAADTYEFNFPLCVDMDNQTAKAWAVTVWPTIAVVDHQGNLRGGGLLPSRVEDAIKLLIDLRTTMTEAREKADAAGSPVGTTNDGG